MAALRANFESLQETVYSFIRDLEICQPSKQLYELGELDFNRIYFENMTMSPTCSSQRQELVS